MPIALMSSVCSSLHDPRCKKGWTELVGSRADDFQIYCLVRHLAMASTTDYKQARENIREFLESLKRIESLSTDLAAELRRLDSLEDNSQFGLELGAHELTILPFILRRTAPSLDEAEKRLFDESKHREIWSTVSPFLFGESLHEGKTKEALATELLVSNDQFLDSTDLAPPSDKARQFLDTGWNYAPSIIDVLGTLSSLASETRNADLVRSNDWIDAAISSRKHSIRRDYLRAVWSRLFTDPHDLLTPWLDEKTTLYNVISDFGSSILELPGSEVIQEADVRQTLGQAINSIREMEADFHTSEIAKERVRIWQEK